MPVSKGSRTTIHHLPPELLQQCFAELSSGDQYRVALTCQLWHDVVERELYAHIDIYRTEQVASWIASATRRQHQLHSVRLAVNLPVLPGESGGSEALFRAFGGVTRLVLLCDLPWMTAKLASPTLAPPELTDLHIKHPHLLPRNDALFAALPFRLRKLVLSLQFVHLYRSIPALSDLFTASKATLRVLHLVYITSWQGADELLRSIRADTLPDRVEELLLLGHNETPMIYRLSSEGPMKSIAPFFPTLKKFGVHPSAFERWHGFVAPQLETLELIQGTVEAMDSNYGASAAVLAREIARGVAMPKLKRIEARCQKPASHHDKFKLGRIATKELVAACDSQDVQIYFTPPIDDDW